MGVKRSQSAARVLSAFELIAQNQPIGVTALAKLLDVDKSAVQRDLMTLADSGWIRIAPGTPTRWELTPHVLTIAHLPHSMNDLRQHARGALEALRRETDETVYLMVPDVRRFIVIDALESRHLLRMVPPIGMVAPVRESATGRAVLAHMSIEEQTEWLGAPPDPEMLDHFAATRARGYSISDGDIVAGSVTLAAPILGFDGRPVGAVVVTGPAERVTPGRRDAIGAAVAQTARNLSSAP